MIKYPPGWRPQRATAKVTAPAARVGWFADVSNDPDQPTPGWQPCLETGTGHIPCFEIWFNTKTECEAYIRDTLIPIAGRLLP